MERGRKGKGQREERRAGSDDKGLGSWSASQPADHLDLSYGLLVCEEEEKEKEKVNVNERMNE